MRAALDDPALVNNQNLVGVSNRRQSMRDDQRGALFHRLIQRPLHGGLALGVEVGGRFVQDDQVG